MSHSHRKLAAISDIHSNSIALDAVLFDIRKKGIDRVINLGDSLYGPIDPNGTFQMINMSGITSISGNQDREILEWIKKHSENPTLEYVKSELTKSALDWLANLPFDLRINDEIYCCHGSPQNDEEYLLEVVKENHVSIRDMHELAEKLAGISQKIILCGHSHIPKSMWVGDKLLVNAGSVGLQAYDDDIPLYHKMENYSPHARYMMITKTGSRYSADIIAVEYDFEKAALLAERNGRKDWAQFIRTGVVNKNQR